MIIIEIAQKITREEEEGGAITIIVVVNVAAIRCLDVAAIIAAVIIRVEAITDAAVAAATTMFITVIDYLCKTEILHYYFCFGWKAFQVSFFYSFLL